MQLNPLDSWCARVTLLPLVLCVFALLQPTRVEATTYRFHHFDYDSHFLAVKVNAIEQDHDGYIWFGTDFGLQRFDGSRVHVFPEDSAVGQGLPSRWIRDIEIDREGALWIGTDAGLSRVDPVALTAKRISPSSDPMFSSAVVRLEFDSQNRLWIATQMGLALYDPSSEQTRVWQTDGDPDFRINSDTLNDLTIDADGSAWVATSDKGVHKVDPRTGKVLVFRANRTNGSSLLSDTVLSVEFDRKESVWVGYANKGISRINVVTGAVENIRDSDPRLASVSNDATNRIFADTSDSVWFGTENSGVFLLPASADEAANSIKPNATNPDGLRASRISDFLQDANGNIWITSGAHGTYFLPSAHRRVDQLSSYSTGWNQLMDNTIWSVYEDRDEQLWIGTNSRGVQILDPKTKTSWSLRHDPDNPNSLGSDLVIDIAQSRNGTVWLGTIAGLDSYDPSTQKVTRRLPTEEHQQAIRVASIFEDTSDNIWVSTLGNGLYRLHDDGAITEYRQSSAEHHISDDYVTAVVEDRAGNLWVGSKGGLDRISRSGSEPQHFDLPNNRVLSLTFDPTKNRLLVGTDGGLVFFDLQTNEATILTESMGLAGEKVYCAIRANQNFLISTSNGITKLQTDGAIESYYDINGLQSGYNLHACAQGRDGRFYFGGNHGVSFFRYDDLQPINTIPRTHITGLRSFDRSAGDQYQSESTTQKSLVLPYTKDDLKISFAGIYFENPRGLTHEYRLIGFDSTWRAFERDDPNIYTRLRADTEVSYTNLAPASYTFEVRHRTTVGVLSEPASLSFQIAPPWFSSKPAWIAYILVALTLLTGFIRWREHRLVSRANQLQTEVAERTAQLAESAQTSQLLAEQKSELLANVSHEFRTPLTLMLGPIHSLRERISDSWVERQLTSIERNAMRLLRMVEQLIDVAVLEGNFRQKRDVYDVSRSMESLVDSIRLASEHRTITLIDKTDRSTQVELIPDSLEKIFTNLVLNAIKYSPIDSVVHVHVSTDDEHVTVSVEDQGGGISSEDQVTIFDRFKRVENADQRRIQGAGLGLAIVKELVLANSGKIDIQSNVGSGTKITVSFRIEPNAVQVPARVSESSPTAVEFGSDSLATSQEVDRPEFTPDGERKTTILIVEDNEEMQQLIIDQLGRHYGMISAVDGESGIKLAVRHMPDLVILDVMLPTIAGLEVATALRGHVETSHIPILMLTAKSDLSSRMEGWRHQVDEYLAKPFHPQELRLRVESLLQIRALLRQKFGSRLAHSSPTEAVSDNARMSADQKFLERFEAVIADNYTNPDFGRSEAARALAVSERQLNRKLSSLVDHNFSAYLRQFRLRKSLELINTGLQVSQIAEQTGFSSASYFSSCFKAEFGQTVKQYSGI